jgi:hypothetical protein
VVGVRAATRHETGALLRAHLAAASGHRHATGHCPVCHRLQRLAMEPGATEPGPASAGSRHDGPEVVADGNDTEDREGGAALPPPAATNNSLATRE